MKSALLEFIGTAGPYLVEIDDDHDGNGNIRDVFYIIDQPDADGDSWHVAKILRTGDPDVDRANADLLGASYQMLAALDAAETMLSPNMASHMCGDRPASGERCGECLGCANWAAWTTATAAIAKALGRASKS